MTLHRASRYMLALALLGLPAAANAQAFGLNEIGSCAIARGFAATAAPCDDASTIYWNPGAMPSKQGLSFYGGVTAIAVAGDFTRDSSYRRFNADVPTAYVPHVFLNYRTTGKSAFGIGVYVPYGLTSQWGDDFPGRFSAKKAKIQSIYVQPNFSYQVNPDWSIGGGPVFGHSTVELVQAIDLASTPLVALGVAKYTEFARATVKGSANAFGVDVGAHGRLGPSWQVGLRFLSKLSFSYDNADATFEQIPTGLNVVSAIPASSFPPNGIPAGTPYDALVAGQFTGTGALTAQKASTQIPHPAQFQIGVGYTGYPNTTLSADYSYVGWKSFSQLPITFSGGATSRVIEEDYDNTSGIRLGAEHRLQTGTALRAGFMATTSAAPNQTVTPLLPEQNRALGTLGVGLPFMSNYGLDLSYAHVFTAGRRGRLDERPAGTTVDQAIALNNGSFVLSANIFSLSLKAAF
ncbi:MAG: fadL [Gemmatimonadetes bacterium]|jgi:long-chain fatty acid transport protein|nr:fadL [Gemmatimonadota bacterium]